MVANAARTQESLFMSLLLSLLHKEKTSGISRRSWNFCGTFLKEYSAIGLPIGNACHGTVGTPNTGDVIGRRCLAPNCVAAIPDPQRVSFMGGQAISNPIGA